MGKVAIKSRSPYTFLFAMNGLSNNDLGVAWGIIIVFQVVWPGAGFKTGDFVEEMLGGLYRRTTRRGRQHVVRSIAISHPPTRLHHEQEG